MLSKETEALNRLLLLKAGGQGVFGNGTQQRFKSCSLMDGCCHTIAVAVLDEKGAHFTNGREETAECFIL